MGALINFYETLQEPIKALVIFFTTWFFCYLLYNYFLRKLGQKFFHLKTEVQTFIFPLLAFYFACQNLNFPLIVHRMIENVTVVAVIIQLTLFLIEFIKILIEKIKIENGENELSIKNTRKNLVTISKVIIWVSAFLFLLDNFGINISTFVTGLGIGGIAIALAAQSILGDAFSSFAIALDKPFRIGDQISFDQFKGFVEYIGFKTTRLRSTGGELLIVPNSFLTAAKIFNHGKMKERRVQFQMGVTYETPLEKLKKVSQLISQAIEEQDQTKVERVYFFQYGSSSLIFDVSYLVLTSDNQIHINILEKINFRIYELFAAEKIEMAYPTQTVIVKR